MYTYGYFPSFCSSDTCDIEKEAEVAIIKNFQEFANLEQTGNYKSHCFEFLEIRWHGWMTLLYTNIFRFTLRPNSVTCCYLYSYYLDLGSYSNILCFSKRFYLFDSLHRCNAIHLGHNIDEYVSNKPQHHETFPSIFESLLVRTHHLET